MTEDINQMLNQLIKLNINIKHKYFVHFPSLSDFFNPLLLSSHLVGFNVLGNLSVGLCLNVSLIK